MKKKNCSRFFLCLLLLLLCMLNAKTVCASTYSQLRDAEKDKERAEERVDRTQDDIDELKEEKIGLQAYLNQLNKELSQASGELAGIEDLISEKETSLLDMQAELERAKEREAEQYVAMKKRIKFMYEKGDSAYMELFFHSKNFADFLNKSEYVEKMSQYDRDMLVEYAEIQETIRRDEQNLVDERVALGALQEQALDKQNEVAEMVVSARENVIQYSDQISAKEEELIKYEQELEESKNDIASLQEQLKKENEMTKQALAAGFSDLSSITFANGDLDLLAAIIYCEAGNQPYVGQVAVGNVVMNRVKSAVFPNTVLEVIYQNRQFSPVGSGRFAIALANHKATPACYAAARDAMAGSAPVGNCLFFRTPIPGLTGIQIGGHIFY